MCVCWEGGGEIPRNGSVGYHSDIQMLLNVCESWSLLTCQLLS